VERRGEEGTRGMRKNDSRIQDCAQNLVWPTCDQVSGGREEGGERRGLQWIRSDQGIEKRSNQGMMGDLDLIGTGAMG